jgi:hypothetical protein
LIDLFQEARDSDYRELVEEARELRDELIAAEKASDAWASGMIGRISRLRQRLTDVQTIDFFPTSVGKQVETIVAEIEGRIRRSPIHKNQPGRGTYSGRVWVTRKGVHVDRIASAWLIRRFVDENARFKFVVAKGYRPDPDELRFDMFDAEFTHEGDWCTFEVLIERLDIGDNALHRIAEIIHDIDLKESKFGRPETSGIALMVTAICRKYKDDTDRIDRGTILLDDLYDLFKRSSKKE